jgi:hypothetical protein
MDVNSVKKIKSLTIAELKKEYYDSDDIFKKTLIKNIIKEKINEIEIKKQLEKKMRNATENILDKFIYENTIKIDKTNKVRTKKINKKNKKVESLNKPKISDGASDDASDGGIFAPYGKIENKFIDEVKKDFTNNKLMERMNSELILRTEGRERKMLKPYMDDDEVNKSSDYKNFKDLGKPEIFGRDFSTIKNKNTGQN